MGIDAKPSFKSLTGTNLRIKVVDVGANPIDGSPSYSGMLRNGEAQVIGFEPNAAALAQLNAAKGPWETFLPHAVGDGQRHTLHFCAAPGMTSLFPPNPGILGLFHGFPVWGKLRETREVETVRLDDIEETSGAQLLKIDVEGGELMVFRNAQRRLRELLVIQTEVEFLPLYSGQPLFSEVELFLRGCGFMFHKFVAVNTRVVQPMLINKDIRAGLSQVIAADVVFVRDLSALENLSDADLLRQAKILHDCYASIDLAYHLLIEYDRRCGKRVAPAYLAGLQSSNFTQSATANGR
jgi:FkbM family methyltransferase